jgi:hypothetical protein
MRFPNVKTGSVYKKIFNRKAETGNMRAAGK